MYRFIILIFNFITGFFFKYSITTRHDKLYFSLGLLSMLIVDKIYNNILYSFLFLLYLLIPFLLIKKSSFTKIYTVLSLVLLIILQLFFIFTSNDIYKFFYIFPFTLHNTYDYFTQAFAIAIPFICLICALWIFQNNVYKTKLFCSSLIVFCYFATQAFVQNNIFLIYAFIEMSIIPMTIILLIYNKNYYLKIIYQYLFYTFISSIFILIGLIAIYNDTHSVLLSDIYKIGVKSKLPLYMLCIGTAIKLPIFPFYYWVPSVHGRSPGICSVLLSSIILKFSSLILVKIILPLYAIQNTVYIGYYIAFGILIATLQMFWVKDLKVIFAYSSVVHMGLYTFTLLYCNNIKYFTYSLLQHTFTMALVFLIFDVLKHSYKCLDFNKILINNKYHLILLIIITLMIVGCPFTWGFISETMALFSVIQYNLVIASIVGLSLLLYSSFFIYVMFTIFKNASINNNAKPDTLQYIILIILIFINVLFGTIPRIYL